MAAIEQEIMERIRKLNPAQQQQVLDFVHGLEHPRGEPGRDFIERTKDIVISSEDLEIMRRVAEEDEERIDWDDWNNPPAVLD